MKQDKIKKLEEVNNIINDEATLIIDAVKGNFSYLEDELFNDFATADDYGESIKNKLKKSIRGRHGIYVFVVKDDVAITRKQLDEYNGHFGGHSAGFNRSPDDGILKMGTIFYLGSTVSDSFQVRFNTHYGDIDDGKAGIKLGIPERAFMCPHLKYYLFPLRKKLEDDYCWILPVIEKELHHRLKPITGSSR